MMTKYFGFFFLGSLKRFQYQVIGTLITKANSEKMF